MAEQTELIVLEETLPTGTLERFRLVWDLLEKATSLVVVSECLKAKGAHHSAGSWNEMRDKRVLVALRSKKITLDDLAHLLNEAEEFGRSHTFLYQTTAAEAARLMDPARLKSVCDKNGLGAALGAMRVEGYPEKPTLTQIRTETAGGRSCVTWKVVQTRREGIFQGQTIEGNKLTKIWTFEDVRTVDVACLHGSGLLELRIQSHASSSKRKEDLKMMKSLLMEFLPPTLFSEKSLAKAKSQMWERRKSLEKKIRFADSTLCNTKGTTIVGSTGGESDDLFDDSAAAGSMDLFIKSGAYCESSNVWWLAQDGIMSRDLHMLLSGEGNEVAITSDCTRREYEYVLNELRVHNK